MLSAQRNKYGKEDVAYREGYVPHFFHAWRVLEDGKIVTSYRSMNEAIKAAEKMKKEGENRNIRVAPALDDFGIGTTPRAICHARTACAAVTP